MYPLSEGKGLWEGQQIVSRPEVHTIQLTEEDNFLILACDGVWDALTCQQAVSYVHRRLLTHRDVQRAAVELLDKVGEIELTRAGVVAGGRGGVNGSGSSDRSNNHTLRHLPSFWSV